ncbi:hypothetical protein N665_0162s0051 [Sinapis alba]|nr:hypothetical protein N665_0162s0051 [Sinapis alba]
MSSTLRPPSVSTQVLRLLPVSTYCLQILVALMAGLRTSVSLPLGNLGTQKIQNSTNAVVVVFSIIIGSIALSLSDVW